MSRPRTRSCGQSIGRPGAALGGTWVMVEEYSQYLTSDELVFWSQDVSMIVPSRNEILASITDHLATD
jgi:hypothetical protein